MAREKLKIEDLIAKGVEAHQAGQFAKAEKIYKRALKIERENSDILHFLGVLSHQKGRHEHAVQLITKALIIKPGDPNYNTNLAIVLNTLKRWPEAERACLDAIKIAPRHAEAFNNLGRSLAAQNKFSEAEAAYIKAIQYAPTNAAAENNLGYLYMQQRKYALAEEVFCRAIKTDKKFLLAYSNLATTYLAMDQLERAEQICHAALSIDPNFVPAIHSLGVVLTRKGKFDIAERTFKAVRKLDPIHGQAVLNLASLYSTQRKFDLAEALFEEAIGLQPNNSNVHLNLGIYYSELGQTEKALSCLKKALEHDPNNVDAYYALSTSGKVMLNSDVLNKLEIFLASSDKVTPDQRTKLYFTLAMQYELLGEMDRSFDYYQSGNQYRAGLVENLKSLFHSELHSKEIDRYKTTFTASYFEGWKPFSVNLPATNPIPIFVVGMPRSGTTLIEQIIGAHPNVKAGGELSIITGFVESFIQSNGGKNQFPENTKLIDLKQIIEWRKDFSDLLKTINNDGYVIDKTPFNYACLWLIQIMYPNAKIIHCKRDARDVGLSCYQQNFTEQYAWSWDLSQIGHYINAYRELMEFWLKTLHLPILDVNYEDVVGEVEASSRNIVEFLEFEWDDRVLDFHSHKGKITTASKWQVREPIYNRSVGRWQKFERQLAPLIETLKSF